MTRRRVKYWASLFLVLTFIIGLISPAKVTTAKAAVELTDISNHWAKDKIVQWVQKGLVSGYTDGTFKPDKSITRAEFMTLVNKAFGFSEKAAIEFSDATTTDWYYEEIAKAVNAGYISGYQDGTVKPNREISRQEAAVALCKVLNLEVKDTDEVDKFTDIDKIPTWSRAYIGALVAGSYMGGYPDGSFKADRSITRAETVTMFDKALTALKVTYDEAGIYGPEEGIETISQDVAINVAGVTLRNMIIEGDLYLNEGIGEGDVTLDNVTVKGITTVRGGGKDSIHLVNFTCEEIIVIKVGGKVRIVASGNTTVEELILESGAHIEGNGIVSVTVLKPGEDVVLDGDFENVSVEAKAKVEVLKGTTINNLQVNSSADINLDKGATVKDLTIEAAVNITGKGTIETAKINADGAKLETEPKEYKIAKDTTAEIAGKKVRGTKDSGSRRSSGGGGGGSDEPKVIEVQSISLNETSVTLAVYEAVYYQKSVTLTATIDPDNATNKKVTWTSSDENVATVKSDGLKATVEAVGEGKATVTVTTDDGGKTAECKVTVVGDEIPVVPVSAISVEGAVRVGETLTAKSESQPNLTATYKWMRADAEDGVYVAIDGATDKTYTLSEADAGKWIKVEVKGTGNYTGTKEKVVGPVEAAIEPVEEKDAEIDYAARYNETRKEWYVKVTVDGEDLDADSINEIWTIKKAGQELDEPQKLTPDADKVLWLPVAGEDGVLYAEKDGEYAYKVVRKDNSKYIFSFTYDSSEVTGLPVVVEVDFDFTGFDGFVAGEENEFSVTATATGIDESTAVRYKATLKKGEAAVVGQSITYEEGKGSGNWKTFTTDENGVAYFGPKDGFTMDELDLSDGVETGFKATIAEAGEYTLTVALVDASDDEVIDEAGTTTFTVAEKGD